MCGHWEQSSEQSEQISACPHTGVTDNHRTSSKVLPRWTVMQGRGRGCNSKRRVREAVEATWAKAGMSSQGSVFQTEGMACARP